MSVENQSVINALVEGFLGPEPARAALAALDLDPRLTGQGGPHVTRAAFAMAMNVALFHDLLERVPSGAAYVADRLARGGKVVFDHGALRTVRLAKAATRQFPPGEAAFPRILEIGRAACMGRG